MLKQVSFLSPDTYPGRLDFFFFFFFSMFESRAKSFLQGIVSGVLSSLFLFKEKTSSQFDEFEAEIVNVRGKVCE